MRRVIKTPIATAREERPQYPNVLQTLRLLSFGPSNFDRRGIRQVIDHGPNIRAISRHERIVQRLLAPSIPLVMYVETRDQGHLLVLGM